MPACGFNAKPQHACPSMFHHGHAADQELNTTAIFILRMKCLNNDKQMKLCSFFFLNQQMNNDLFFSGLRRRNVFLITCLLVQFGHLFRVEDQTMKYFLSLLMRGNESRFSQFVDNYNERC